MKLQQEQEPQLTTHSGCMDIRVRNPYVLRKVHFNDTVQVRVYAITVGDVPIARDSCPVTLDGPYLYQSTLPLRGGQEQQQEQRRYPLRRRSLATRRAWIAQVQGCSLQTVRAWELERVLERLEEAMMQQEARQQQRRRRQLQQKQQQHEVAHTTLVGTNYHPLGVQQQDKDEEQPALYPFSERSDRLFASNREWVPCCQARNEPSSLRRVSLELEQVATRWACEVVLEAAEEVLQKMEVATE